MKPDAAYEQVSHAIAAGHAAHGYLVTGNMRDACLPFATRVLGDLFPAADPTVHPDVHWLRPETKSRIIAVEAMREKIIAPMELTSFSGGWRAGVIVGADRLKTESANAFLKTLEEPPAKTVFFLLTDAPERLLPTIVSRCQRIDLDGSRTMRLEEPYRGAVLAALRPSGPDSALARLTMAETFGEILEALEKKASERVDAEIERESAAAEETDKKKYEARVSAHYREYRAAFLATLYEFFAEEMRKTARGCGTLRRLETFYDLEAVDQMATSFDRNLPEATVLSFFTDRIRLPAERAAP